TIPQILYIAIINIDFPLNLLSILQCRNISLECNFPFSYLLQDLLYSLLTEDIYRSLCYSVHPNGVAAYWSLLFAISKLVEFVDTLFIVLKKKPLIFLHYYHHAAVLIYTVHSGAENTAAGRAFISMNFFAHSLMYTYYAFTAAKLRPPRWISMGVTTVQIVQMLIGVTISAYVYKIKAKEHLPLGTL
uniref:Elongation of very long chain fatty acids protein n=1 Tax=Parascaris univalens TaxID=6257 RepID=A0A915AZF4_PARUN